MFRSITRQQIEDYIFTIRKLLWQRQAIFLAATVLAAFYFDTTLALACYFGVLLTEWLDMQMARWVLRWNDLRSDPTRRIFRTIICNTILSSLAISVFVMTIALQQPSSGHFTPLFFLFAAALFAAMNNHQIPAALVVRLSIYGMTFLAVALIDIVRYTPPIHSQAWLQFFTVVFVLYFIVDVSLVFLSKYREQRGHLERIKSEHRKATEALSVKSAFVSTVSHELRTPLTSIKGSLDLLNSGALGEVPESFRSVLDIAGRNSERLASLINDILDIQSIENGNFVGRLDPVSVDDLVEESVRANMGYAEVHGVFVRFVRAADQRVIAGDERRLIQVMSNLLSNAIKFSRKGETVDVWSEAADGKVRVYVKDTGIGIPKGAKDKVFGRFSQVDGSDQRRTGGTGLGMNISKQIMELHNGHIDYSSDVGVGSTFMIELDEASAVAEESMLELDRAEDLFVDAMRAEHVLRAEGASAAGGSTARPHQTEPDAVPAEPATVGSSPTGQDAAVPNLPADGTLADAAPAEELRLAGADPNGNEEAQLTSNAETGGSSESPDATTTPSSPVTPFRPRRVARKKAVTARPTVDSEGGPAVSEQS